jgi:hypothetical protein
MPPQPLGSPHLASEPFDRPSLQVGKEQRRTLVAFNSRSPTFNTSFEFFEVTAVQELQLQVGGPLGAAACQQHG